MCTISFDLLQVGSPLCHRNNQHLQINHIGVVNILKWQRKRKKKKKKKSFSSHFIVFLQNAQEQIHFLTWPFSFPDQRCVAWHLGEMMLYLIDMLNTICVSLSFSWPDGWAGDLFLFYFLLLPVKWQNWKNLVTRLMPFIQGGTIHGLAEYSASQAVEQSFWGILDKSRFYRVSVSRDNQKTGQDWLRGRGFPCKASRSHFLGKVKGTQAEWEDWLVRFSQWVLPPSAGWCRVRFVTWGGFHSVGTDTWSNFIMPKITSLVQ